MADEALLQTRLTRALQQRDRRRRPPLDHAREEPLPPLALVEEHLRGHDLVAEMGLRPRGLRRAAGAAALPLRPRGGRRRGGRPWTWFAASACRRAARRRRGSVRLDAARACAAARPAARCSTCGRATSSASTPRRRVRRGVGSGWARRPRRAAVAARALGGLHGRRPAGAALGALARPRALERLSRGCSTWRAPTACCASGATAGARRARRGAAWPRLQLPDERLPAAVRRGAPPAFAADAPPPPRICRDCGAPPTTPQVRVHCAAAACWARGAGGCSSSTPCSFSLATTSAPLRARENTLPQEMARSTSATAMPAPAASSVSRGRPSSCRPPTRRSEAGGTQSKWPQPASTRSRGAQRQRVAGASSRRQPVRGGAP